MAYASQPRNRNGFDPRSLKLDFAPEDEDWRQDPETGRDFKKYILIIGLGALSWVATYIGMLELIQANLGTLPFTHKVVIGFSVAMLMVMIIWLLDQLFKPHAGAVKLAYVGGYLFLTLISVGFGFGFYWKVLESRTEASRSAESAVGQVQSSLNAASTRLEQLQATLAQLADVSQKKSELERTKGTSCPNSRPGDGPRRKMRAEDAAKFTFASEFVAGRVGAIKTDMKALDGDLIKIAKKDPAIVDPKSGTRNQFMRALGRKLDLTVAGFNAFRTDPQLLQLRSDLAERADKTIFKAASGKTFACPDAQLQQALRGTVRALDQLPTLEKPEIAVVEGSEATIEAFRRLTATLQGLLTFKLPPSADELRELQQKAIRQAVSKTDQAKLKTAAVGLSSRDYVPLAIAIFVDLCLLLVSMGRATNRIENLIPKMRAAERGPVIEILSRFKDIHRDPQVRDNFEVFRHVVFDQNGDYYVAVPLDAPFKGNPRAPLGEQYGTEQAQELQHEAHLLANLFTSFEKERIFRRVYNPVLLNTRAIQKRLARQGSKFAGCEAFRVYKFRNGAWSEIILGAVMGAARRAETKRRRAQLEEELFATKSGVDNTEAFAPFGVPGLSNPTVTAPVDDTVSARTRATTQTAAFDFSAQVRPGRTEDPDRHNIGFGGPDPITDNSNADTHPASDTRTTRTASAHVTSEHEAKYGPYAMHIAEPDAADFDSDEDSDWAPLPLGAEEADVTLTAPTDRDHDHLEDSTPVTVQSEQGHDVVSVEMQSPAASTEPVRDAAMTVRDTTSEHNRDPKIETSVATPLAVNTALTDGHVDVVLTRDTATISVPVTEATLPQGVAGLMRNALAAADKELNGTDVVSLSETTDQDVVPLDDGEETPIALPYDPRDTEIGIANQVVETKDVEEVSRLASRFAARTDV